LLRNQVQRLYIKINNFSRNSIVGAATGSGGGGASFFVAIFSQQRVFQLF
jgi:hypothetical protein